MNTPRFAVVGRPNKGKSSIVATLARDDSVLIESRSGSTRKATCYPMSVNGEVLYELIDTPGIQRARRTLEWLTHHSKDASDRPATVARFVETFRDSDEFRDECELLTPIVEGAAIIYVVDGSCPFGAEYEAEMDILRWCGRPSLALINPIDNDHYVDAWRAGLQQFFQTVRVFNAARAEHAKQLALLELFGHLDPQWRAPIDRAIQVLSQHRQHQHYLCSSIIADTLINVLRCEVRENLLPGVPESLIQSRLWKRYQATVSQLEQECRRQVEDVYAFRHLSRQEQDLALENSDLFDTEHWYLWGLSKKSLLAVAASAGAIAGAGAGITVDGLAGGLLGGSATTVAGTLGALGSSWGAWKYANEIAQLRVKGIPTGGKTMIVGPSRNPNFPFVFLGRALLHLRLLNRRTHADRSELSLDQHLLSPVPDQQRRQLGAVFVALQQGKSDPKLSQKLTQLIGEILAEEEKNSIE